MTLYKTSNFFCIFSKETWAWSIKQTYRGWSSSCCRKYLCLVINCCISLQTVNKRELVTTFFLIIKVQSPLPFDALAWNSRYRMSRSVSFSDFISFEKHFASTSSEEKLEGIFKLFDNNNEGILRRHEVRKFAVVKLKLLLI